jgi:glycosyltransferase involved in cell wall biosynthesis
MNILFLDQFSELGGAQQCLLDLLPAVAARGWRAHLAVPGQGPLCQAARRWCVTVEEIHCGPYGLGNKSIRDFFRFGVDTVRLRARIAEFVERYRIDLVYVNGPRVLPAARLAGGSSGSATLFHCHHHLGWPYQWMARQCARGVTVVGCCRYVLEQFQEHPDAHVVYNGVEGGSKKSGISGSIGVIGRIAPEKGQAEFLEAARGIHGVRLVICGTPLFSDRRSASYMNRLRVLANGLPVEFLGWRDDAGGVLRALDMLVVPSVSPSEATPRVILEAFAAGVPVLASRISGVPELVEDGRTGFLVEAGSPRALAARIQEVLDLPQERLLEVVERAHHRWRERFTVRRYQEEMIGEMERCAPRSCTIGC